MDLRSLAELGEKGPQLESGKSLQSVRRKMAAEIWLADLDA
jgi:hypothetical protein